MLIIIFKYLYSTVHSIDTSENSKGSLTLTCLFAFVFMGGGVRSCRRVLEAPSGLSDRLLDRPLLSLGMSSKYIHSCRQKRRFTLGVAFVSRTVACIDVPASPKQPVDPIRACVPTTHIPAGFPPRQRDDAPLASCLFCRWCFRACVACVCVSACVCVLYLNFKSVVKVRCLNVRRRCQRHVASPRCRPEVP